MKHKISYVGILAVLLTLTGVNISLHQPRTVAALPCRSSYEQDFRWRELKRTGQIYIVNKTGSKAKITLYHPDAEAVQGTWNAPPGKSYLPRTGYYVGDDWGIQIGSGCIFYVGEVGTYQHHGNGTIYRVTLSPGNIISISGLTAEEVFTE